MSETLFGFKSEQPEICACCARPAIPVAVKGGFFMCAFCSLTLTFKVAAMKPNQLHDLEHGAIEAAVKMNMKPMLEEVLRCLWNNGVKNLADLNEGKISELCIELGGDGVFTETIKQCFLSYTHEIRRELTNLKADQ